MKRSQKIILPLLFLLASCLLLSACDLSEPGFEAQSSTELSTSNETGEVTTVTPETQEVSSQPQQPPYEKEIIGLDHALVSALTEHIDFLDAFIDHASPAYSIDLDSFQYRRQVFFVKFDKDNYYYACAYFNPTHQKAESYPNDLCCVEEYTWVRYDSPEQIPETYNGLGFVCAFQVNKTLFCEDIGTGGGAAEGIEHFKRYTTKFENGFNVDVGSRFEQSFLYINNFYAIESYKTIYHSVESQEHPWCVYRCVERNGQFYVPIYLYTMQSDGTRVESSRLQKELGAFYDEVMRVLIMDEYHERDDYYGLITVEDLERIVHQQ